MLASELGLSESACLARLRRLEQNGHVLGYTALLNPALQGHAVQAWFELKLKDVSEVAKADFEKLLDAAQSVVAAYRTDTDAYLVKVGAPNLTSLEMLARRSFETQCHCLRRWLIVDALSVNAG